MQAGRHASLLLSRRFTIFTFPSLHELTWTEELKELFNNAGFDMEEGKLVEKDVVNEKRKITMARKWIQCRFVKR